MHTATPARPGHRPAWRVHRSNRATLRRAMFVIVALLTVVSGILPWGIGASPEGCAWAVALLWAWWLAVPQTVSLLVSGRLPARRIRQPRLVSPTPHSARAPRPVLRATQLSLN